MALEDLTVRPLPRIEPAARRGTSRGIVDSALTAPAARQIHAAYDELAEHYVDAISAQEWLSDLVGTIGEDRARQELAPLRDVKRPALPDSTKTTDVEDANIRRLLTVALAVLNGRRPHMRDLNDKRIATTYAQSGINTAAAQVASARLKTVVTIRRIAPEAHRAGDRTTFYVPGLVTWGDRFRALAAVLDADKNGAYRLTGFTIL